MATVTFDHVTKKFGEVFAVNDLSLQVKDEEFLVLVGPSGCGKTTALRMIAGLEEQTSGDIFIGERLVNDVAPKDRDIAMVFQNYALYPHMSVYDNIAFGLKLRGMPKTEIDRRVGEVAEMLGLQKLLKRKPKELSGGQRQRVAVGRAIAREPAVFLMDEPLSNLDAALLGLERYLDRKPKALSGGERQRVALGRALVRRPAVFLFDEPLSNLDAQLRVHMRAELHKLHQRIDATMIYVTHDQVEAMTLGDRIAVLKAGVLQQVDAPLTVYERPVNRFVAGFLGSPSMNFVDAVVDGAAVRVGEARWTADGALAAALGAHAGAKVTAGVRPEHLTLSDAPGALRGQIEFGEILGAERLLYVQTPAGRIVVRVAPDHAATIGANVGLMPEPGSLRVFDAEEKAVGMAAPVGV